MKTINLLLFLVTLLSANSGENVFNNNCLSCHVKESIPFEKFKKIRSHYKAPPMNLVVGRLKDVISISLGDEDAKKAVVTAFIKDYILSPSIDKGLCRVECFVQFGEMPKIQTPLTNEELDLVSDWIYERY